MEPTSEPVSPETPIALTGSCACGLVVYRSRTLPLSITLCHCVPCRKASGAPFLSFGLFHNTALDWGGSGSQPAPPIKVTPSPVLLDGYSIAVRGTCGNCGSPLYMKYHCRPDATSVVMGIVNDEDTVGTLVKPKEHIFLHEKALWWSTTEDDGLARHGRFNEEFQRRLKEWVAAGAPRRVDV